MPIPKHITIDVTVSGIKYYTIIIIVYDGLIS